MAHHHQLTKSSHSINAIGPAPPPPEAEELLHGCDIWHGAVSTGCRNDAMRYGGCCC
jgi:hypothetical protein